MTSRPSREDPVLAALSNGVGGPVGDHATRHPWWTPLRVVLALTALCFALGMVSKSACYDDAWTDDPGRYAALCDSSLPHDYVTLGLLELDRPLSADPQVRERFPLTDQAAGSAHLAWGAAWLAHVLSGSPDLEERYAESPADYAEDPEVLDQVRTYVVVTALLLAALALLSAGLLARVDPRRPWRAAAFGAAPVLLLTGVLGLELAALACVAGALWAWSRDRLALTGVLLGLGTAVLVHPALLLLAVAAVAVRRGRPSDAVPVVVSAVTTWAAVNLPAYVSGPAQWRATVGSYLDRGAGEGSVWLVADQAADLGLSADAVTRGSALLLLLWCAAVGLLVARAPRTPELAQVGLLVVAGLVLVSRSYEPQHALWLLPLAALAVPRWRDLLVWQAGEVVHFALLGWYLGGFLAPAGGGDAGFYWLAVVLRVGAQLYLVAVVVQDVRSPVVAAVRDVTGSRHAGSAPSQAQSPTARSITDDRPRPRPSDEADQK